MTSEELQKLLDRSKLSSQLPMNKDIDVEGPVTDINMNDLDPKPLAQPVGLPPLEVEPIDQKQPDLTEQPLPDAVTPPVAAPILPQVQPKPQTMSQPAADEDAQVSDQLSEVQAKDTSPAPESAIQALLNKYNESRVKFDPSKEPISGYKSDLSDDALKAALEEKRHNLMIAGMLRAGKTIGAAIGHIDPDYAGSKALEDQAGLSLEGIQTRRKGADEELKHKADQLGFTNVQNSFDGNSMESKMAVTILRSANPKLKIPDGTPAATIYKLAPLIKDKVEKQMPYISAGTDQQGHPLIMDKRTGDIITKGQTKADQTFQVKNNLTGETNLVSRRSGDVLQGKSIGTPSATTGQEATAPDLYNTLNAKQRETTQKHSDNFLKDTAANRDALTSAEGVRNMLAAGSDGRIDHDILRAVQNQLARASGEKGTMTENDVAPFGGRANASARIGRYLKMETVGQIPDADRKFLSDISRVMEDTAAKTIEKQAAPYIANIQRDTGKNPEQAKTLLNVKASTGMQEAPQDPKITKWAKEHKMPYDKAAAILAARGYKANGGK